MKSIISFVLLLAAFTLHSCNTQTQKPLNGQTYYLLFFSNTLASEIEMHFLSSSEVAVKLTAIGDTKGLADLRAHSATKVYKYWLSDSVIDIPEYDKGLKIYLRKRIISFGYSSGIPPFDSGILYKTSVLNPLSNEELLLKVRNIAVSEDDVQYFLKMLKIPKHEAQEVFEKELPIEQKKVEQSNDVIDEDQPGHASKSFTHTIQDRTIVTKPSPDAEFKEGGEVVLHVTVNSDGEVVDTKIKSASNDELEQIALKKASELRFNKSDNAKNQSGDVTFMFKTRQHK